MSGEWVPEWKWITVCAIGQCVGNDLPYRAVGSGGVRVRGLPCVTSAFAVWWLFATDLF